MTSPRSRSAWSGPAGFAELVARAGTPAHLLTPDTEPDLELFMAVTTELGDVVLGPPGTMPTDLDDGDDAVSSSRKRPATRSSA